MLKKSYKILKYIYKNPTISKGKICEKFSDFERYESTILDYVIIEDNNVDIEQESIEKLILEADEKGMKISEQTDYITENMKDIENVYDEELVLYSTNLKFNEYREKKKRDAWLFWVPYTITTIIAIIALFK